MGEAGAHFWLGMNAQAGKERRELKVELWMRGLVLTRRRREVVHTSGEAAECVLKGVVNMATVSMICCIEGGDEEGGLEDGGERKPLYGGAQGSHVAEQERHAA